MEEYKMKTSEFIEKLDKHKGKFLIENIYSDDELYLTSIKTNQFNITFYHDEEPSGIIDIIAEYLNTPVNERECEKKYYLKQIGIENNHSFLNYDSSICEYSTYDKREFGVYKTQFTQSEIDNLPECYKHPAVWEQVPVKERDNV